MLLSFRSLAAFVLLLSSASQQTGVAATVSVQSGVILSTGYNVACGDRTSTTGNGCKKNGLNIGNRLPTTEVNSTERHEVRCCSDNSTRPPAPITNAVKNVGCTVWGYSKFSNATTPSNAGCNANKTYAEAEAICVNSGGRLCTVEEILNQCTKGSVCDFDNQHVWTKSRGSGPTGASYQVDYLGCYVDNNAQHLSLKIGAPYSVDGCSQVCEAGRYPYFGLKNGDTCFCGSANNEDSRVNITQCASTCLLGNGRCGGNFAVSVYKTDVVKDCEEFHYESRFRSCVKDTDVHFERKLSGAFGVKTCVDACTVANFSLAVLAEGDKCWCGDEEPLAPAYDCNIPCSIGNGVCGGNNQTRAVSMYRTPVVKPTIKTLGKCRGQLANWWGDPHFVTYDNIKYNCYGIGHFTITQCRDYKMQAIFKKATNTATSVTHGVVAQFKTQKVQVIMVNTSSSLSSSFVNSAGSCWAELYVNGQVFNTSSASLTLLNRTTGIDIVKTSTSYTVSFPSPGPAFRVTPYMGQGCMMNVDTCMHQECIGSTTYPVLGLLGTPNTDNTDDLMHRNGTVWYGTDHQKYCTNIWCIERMADSLFTYPPGTNYSLFDKCAALVTAPPVINPASVNPTILEACLKMALDKTDEDNCLLDVDTPGATGPVESAMLNNAILAPDMADTAGPPLPVNDCEKQVILYNTNGVTPLADIGTLYLVNRSSTDGTVTLQWYNVSGVNPARVYIEYESEGSANLCANTTASTAKPFKVSCPPEQLSTLVHVTVSDVDSLKPGDAAGLNECCKGQGDLNPKVKYTFVVPCVDPCPPKVVTRRCLLRTGDTDGP